MSDPHDDEDDDYEIDEETRALAFETVDVAPGLTAVLAEHIADYDMLPHVYFGDVSRWAEAEAARSGGSSELVALLALLESSYLTGNGDVQNLIDASFIEMVEDNPAIVKLLQPVLLSRVQPYYRPTKSVGYPCPVCGYSNLKEPPRLPGGGGSYEICWSCGFEFGVTDDDNGYSYLQWRERWIASGMSWATEANHPRPKGWDPAAQLASLMD
ncbi:hypothetical protein [uncultured Jatrophihabitans sp.]|uniref:DUF7674 family protein n=1 Tax=uncultured Jatrophihabitans sp. TaxID=1610747 RepID=UPI0035CB3B54